MWNLLKAELLKLRRCQILWVGLVALALCPLVQYGSQLIVEAEYRNPNYDFSTLFENVVWGNTQMFFPISLVMIGSWLIDRESTHDTLKNIMTIPVSMPKMLGAKLFWVGIFAVLLGIYSVGVTLITGLTVGLSGLTVEVFFHGGTQIVLAALTTYLVCMPLILIFGQIRGAYLGGSILAFFLGYSMMFGEVKKEFFFKNVKGCGYADTGKGVITEFYTPVVPKGYDFLREIGTLAAGLKQVCSDRDIMEDLQ